MIRPLAYVSEAQIARYAQRAPFPIIPCTLCGSQQNLQRLQIKKMLNAWEREFPNRTQTIFAALRNVAPEHLADTRLHDFAGLDALRCSDARIAPMDLFHEEDALAAREPALA